MSINSNTVQKASQRHSLVTVQGIDIVWRSFSGGGRVEGAAGAEVDDPAFGHGG